MAAYTLSGVWGSAKFVGRISAAPSGKDMRPLPDGGVRLIRPTGKCEICRPDKRSAIRQSKAEINDGVDAGPTPARQSPAEP